MAITGIADRFDKAAGSLASLPECSRFSALIVAIISWVAIVTPVAAITLITFVAGTAIVAPTAIVAAISVGIAAVSRIISTVPVGRP
jgi:hypothetical protein